MKRIAVVPARSGSKRISNKNIREFCGKPMLAHVLMAAQTSNLFETIHVSTESKTVYDVAAAYGSPPDFLRPHELADDLTPIMPVLRHVVREYAKRGRNFDEAWVLMACAPLLDSETLIEAAGVLDRHPERSALLAVTEFPAPIQRAYALRADGMLSMAQPEMFPVRSQDLEKHYFDAGSFAAYRTKRVLDSEGAGTSAEFIGFVLPKGSAVDIDEEPDWELAEALYRIKHSRGAKN